MNFQGFFLLSFKQIFSLTKNMNHFKCPPKESPKSGKQLNDVFIVNLGWCSDVQVKNEINAAAELPPSLNLQKVCFIFFLM